MKLSASITTSEQTDGVFVPLIDKRFLLLVAFDSEANLKNTELATYSNDEAPPLSNTARKVMDSITFTAVGSTVLL